MEKSPELRAIKYSIEKSKNLDLVKFFQNVKNMVATVLSINFEVLIMDNLVISRKDLSQVMSAIFKQKLVKKMYLLKKIDQRSSPKGIVSSELAVVLISDMVRGRIKKEKLANKEKIDFAEFWSKGGGKSKSLGGSGQKKISLKFNEGDDQFLGADEGASSVGLSDKKTSKFYSEKKKKKKNYKKLIM